MLKDVRDRCYLTVAGDEAVEFLRTKSCKNVVMTHPQETGHIYQGDSVHVASYIRS